MQLNGEHGEQERYGHQILLGTLKPSPIAQRFEQQDLSLSQHLRCGGINKWQSYNRRSSVVCSTVLVPDRVAHALNLNLENMVGGGNVQHQQR
ncbi:hypothetical protein RJT34_17715 [Clitoria ternatea]|uniref:Uncharacterized protein n=1 Tax=Clitoria ternatea TaxID=43366 RepID=A0AAN9J9U6_CLITE